MSAALRLMTQPSAQKLTMVTLFNSVYGLHDKYWQKRGGMVPTPKDPFTQVRYSPSLRRVGSTANHGQAFFPLTCRRGTNGSSRTLREALRPRTFQWPCCLFPAPCRTRALRS